MELGPPRMKLCVRYTVKVHGNQEYFVFIDAIAFPSNRHLLNMYKTAEIVSNKVKTASCRTGAPQNNEVYNSIDYSFMNYKDRKRYIVRFNNIYTHKFG